MKIPEGRIGRLEYFTGALTLGFVAGVLIDVLPRNAASAACLYLAFLIGHLIFVIRRCHDLNWSGWASFIIFIPIVGGIFVICLKAVCREPFRIEWFSAHGLPWSTIPVRLHCPDRLPCDPRVRKSLNNEKRQTVPDPIWEYAEYEMQSAPKIAAVVFLTRSSAQGDA